MNCELHVPKNRIAKLCSLHYYNKILHPQEQDFISSSYFYTKRLIDSLDKNKDLRSVSIE